MIGWLLIRFVSPRARRFAAAVILDVSIVLWPLSALTWARDEPPWILGLSYLAITVTCADVLLTSDVRRQQEGAAA